MTLVALIDGALAAGHPSREGFLDLTAGAVTGSPAGRHAAAMAAAILGCAPEVRIYSIAVLPGALTARSADLARALEAAGATGASIVHCSLGLARNDPDVARAAEELVAAGCSLVASAAARGGPVYPAALPGVISVQGDARCAPHEWSHLALPTAAYGACPRLGADPSVVGASVAAAHLTGRLCVLGATGPAAARRALEDGATYRGRERRTSPGPHQPG